MMKAIAGSMVGGLVAGTIALVASAANQNGADASRAVATSPVSMLDTNTPVAPLPEPTLVQCEPHQQAMMRRTLVDGRDVATVACIRTMPLAAPAVSMPLAPVAAAATPVSAAQPAVVRERIVERAAPRAAKRSWQKSALVIGGTSGAGAGLGALLGGKKGALIGAAIGGGSGAIYEVSKR